MTIAPLEIWQIPCLDLPDASLAALAAALTPIEHDQEARYRQRADRLRFRVGRGLTRLLSSKATGIAPADLVWAQSDQGKPRWENAELPFNVSHSGDWVFLAIGGSDPLGIDVQQEDPRIDADAIAAYALSPEENSHLAKLPKAQRRKDFFDLWVLREAGLKATGQGVYDQSQRVSALPMPRPGEWQAALGLNAEGLWLRFLTAPYGYSAALGMIAGQAPSEPFDILGPEDLYQIVRV